MMKNIKVMKNINYEMMLMEDRIHFYLGNYLIHTKNIDVTIFPKIKTIHNLNLNNQHYDLNLYNLLVSTKNANKKFFYSSGDIEKYEHGLTLCKNRCKENRSSVILKCLNFNKHWYLYYNKPKDIDYASKISSIFWRGTTTGRLDRFILILNWFNKDENINIGFSNVSKNKTRFLKYVKGPCGVNEFLKYKYILSIEGNDKDSGLNWKLNSNSVVLMSAPKVCSWLMETTLVPNYHYVLLKDDFSNLKEKLDWCNDNPDVCKEIINNANIFMKQFSDLNSEIRLEKEVINKYFEILDNNKC